MTSPRRRPPASRGAVIALTVFLAAYNNVWNLLRPSTFPYVVVNATTAGGLLLIGGRAGLDAAAMGVDRRQLRAGVAWGAAAAGCVCAALAAVSAHPRTRRLLDDRRAAGLTRGELARWVGLRIPLGTVLLEEVAFRGVLYAALRDHWPTAVAAAGSSVTFGVWHVLPTLQTLEINAPAASPSTRAGAVAAAVAATTAVGMVLCGLRRASGGILASGLAHFAANAVFATAAARRRRRGSTPGFRV